MEIIGIIVVIVVIAFLVALAQMLSLAGPGPPEGHSNWPDLEAMDEVLWPKPVTHENYTTDLQWIVHQEVVRAFLAEEGVEYVEVQDLQVDEPYERGPDYGNSGHAKVKIGFNSENKDDAIITRIYFYQLKGRKEISISAPEFDHQVKVHKMEKLTEPVDDQPGGQPKKLSMQDFSDSALDKIEETAEEESDFNEDEL